MKATKPETAGDVMDDSIYAGHRSGAGYTPAPERVVELSVLARSEVATPVLLGSLDTADAERNGEGHA